MRAMSVGLPAPLRASGPVGEESSQGHTWHVKQPDGQGSLHRLCGTGAGRWSAQIMWHWGGGPRTDSVEPGGVSMHRLCGTRGSRAGSATRGAGVGGSRAGSVVAALELVGADVRTQEGDPFTSKAVTQSPRTPGGDRGSGRGSQTCPLPEAEAPGRRAAQSRPKVTAPTGPGVPVSCFLLLPDDPSPARASFLLSRLLFSVSHLPATATNSADTWPPSASRAQKATPAGPRAAQAPVTCTQGPGGAGWTRLPSSFPGQAPGAACRAAEAGPQTASPGDRGPSGARGALASKGEGWRRGPLASGYEVPAWKDGGRQTSDPPDAKTG